MRLTADWVKPVLSASPRLLQCVAPFGVDSNVSFTTRSTSSSPICRGTGGETDIGVNSERSHALEQSGTGRQNRLDPVRCEPHLEGLRTPTAPQRIISAIHRSLAGREGPRHCRAVHESTGSCARPLCRREKPNPGVKSNPTSLAHATRTGGAPQS